MRSGTWRTRSRLLGALVVVALAGSGCTAIGPIGNAVATDVVSRTLSIAGTPALRVETFNGPVRVLAGPAGTVAVSVERRGSGRDDAAARADLANVDVSIEATGSAVTVRARRSDDPDHAGNSGADVTVTLPATASVDLQTSNGEITSTGVAGPVKAATSNGPITVSGATAGVDARTSNGPITAIGATAGVTAHSSGGPIVVRGASGIVDVGTTNGPVTVDAVAATVHARTSSGRVTFTGQLSPGAHTFETTNGDVELTLPAGAAFAVDARTTGAEIESEFEVNTSETAHGVLVGTVGGPAPSTSISVSTSNGAIRLHRSR